MTSDASTNKDNRTSLPPYKDPISAGILSFLALIFLFIGIIVILIPLIASVEVKNQLKNTIYFSIGNQIMDASIISFILLAIGCFIFSAILYVLSNIACDTHLTEYNIRQLLLDTQRKQEELTKRFQHIEDSITKQSDVAIYTISNDNSSANMP